MELDIRHLEDQAKPVVNCHVFPHSFYDTPIGHRKNIVVPIDKKNIPVVHGSEDVHRLLIGGVVMALIAID